jgi:hypothetical protein
MVYAQSPTTEELTMATIHLETELAVGPDELWATVRDVGNVSGLLNIVEESSVDGDQRSCTLAGGGGLLAETILAVDDDHRRVAYTITDSPLPIELHAASMQVFDAGGGRSTFRWITDVKPDALADGLGPMLAGAVTGMEEHYGT